MFEKLHQCLDKIHQIKPLILNVTNYVTMDFMANCLLALGAAPIMSEDTQELPELVALSNAVNLNGTVNDAFMARAGVAAKEAKRQERPLILDPVGAGATLRRTSVASAFLPFASIVRGNASEIMALSNSCTKTLGVESTHISHEAQDAAHALAEKFNLVAVVSGAVDHIVGRKTMTITPFGNSLMQRVTGMGCALTAVIAAFRAINSDSFEAAHLATAYFGLCGEQAAHQATAPRSFRTAFIDALYNPNLEEMKQRYA